MVRESGLTLPVVETVARQERRGCHNRSRAPSFGPVIPETKPSEQLCQKENLSDSMCVFTLRVHVWFFVDKTSVSQVLLNHFRLAGDRMVST